MAGVTVVVPEEVVTEARVGFPVLDRIAYLNAGTFGPLSRRVGDAMRDAQERDLAEGRSGMPYFLETLELREQVRRRVGELVGAEPGTVALTSSTTEGCNIVLTGLGLTEDDEVVTTTDEHFGMLGALGASAARVVVVEPDADRILAAVTPRTRLLALSEALWTTGALLPVRELRDRSGVPVLVDGAQSAGAIPVDVRGVDFFTISGQKWLCGPDATGALVVTDPERLRVAAPSYFRQLSFAPDGSYEPRAGAPRFEQGWWSPARLLGLLAALDQRPAWAFDVARTRAEHLRGLLAGIAEVITPAERCTLVSFRPGDVAPDALVERLFQADVHVRELPGRGIVRASVGWWTSEGDLQRLAAGVGH
jgi:L-cysteine/cystine lyase